MKRYLMPTLGLCGTLLLGGCATDDGPTAPVAAPEQAISDGAHEGNAHFFFLPPMVPAPSPSGTFDGTLSPVVEICIWDGSECGASLEIYNTETGPGSETVRVVPEGKHYIVNWHTDDILETFSLGPGETFRIRVLVGLQVVGFADVAVVNNGKELKNVATDEFIPLIDGRTLPIKFRIEEGALISGEIVSAGRNHTCTVDASGAAYCWGHNYYGQVGDGTRTVTYPYAKTSPVAVTGGHTFQSVSAGLQHSCGVTTDGDAYCWGHNLWGQLGTGYTSDPSATPVEVTGGHKFQSVSVGGNHTCGVTTDGDAYCWGYNGFGQLGTGYTSYYSATPVAVIGGHKFQSVSTGLWYHTCGLAADGNGFCWGLNYYGQVGDGTDRTWGYPHEWKPSPTAVIGGHTFQSLDAGTLHSCGVTTAGDAYCWGHNYYGQVGDGTYNPTRPYNKPNPTAVTGGLSFQHASAGRFHSCGLTTNGAAYCWGYNGFGQLGIGYASNREPTPVPVIGGHTFQSVSAGYGHSCGATTANDGFCWGANHHGEVGDGTRFNRSSPVLVDLDPPTP